MSRRSNFAQDIISRQERMLRLAERDYGLTPAVIKAETDIPKETLATWRKETAMPAWALVALSRIIPDELTSLLFEPIGKHVGTDQNSDGDLDELAEEAAEFVTEYTKARSPRSPGGSNIVPMEREHLKDRSRRIAVKARKAAA